MLNYRGNKLLWGVGLVMFFLLGIALGTLTIAYVWASPADVCGSGNVAVTGYANSKGNFILWSSGRITDLAGKEINASSHYSSVTGARLPSRLSGQILGARRVAVGILPHTKATYVLFSDGTVAQPTNDAAKAPASTETKIVYGTYEYGIIPNKNGKGSGNYRISLNDSNSSEMYQSSLHCRIHYDGVFTEPPTVLLGNCYGWSVKEVGVFSCFVSYSEGQQLYSVIPSGFSFVAFGK